MTISARNGSEQLYEEGTFNTEFVRCSENMSRDVFAWFFQMGTQQEWKRCAVVGNSGALLYSRYGKLIDSHDVVFRMNQAPTHGYETYVGHKATHRLLNRLWTLSYSNATVEIRLFPRMLAVS